MPPRRRGAAGPAAGGTEPRPGEIYIEFRTVGNAMRVTAVDAETGEEVVVMGPRNAAQADLQRIAVRKLKLKLGKN